MATKKTPAKKTAAPVVAEAPIQPLEGQGATVAAVETKTYDDGAVVTGQAPLPEQSPAQQDAAAALPPPEPRAADPIPPAMAYHHPPVFDLAEARALPDVTGTGVYALAAFEHPAAITAFRDIDGRTMRIVAVTRTTLGKAAHID